jgi:hypothetical protein
MGGFFVPGENAMPRNNTGNPLPSSSPLDREDNSLILEELINAKDKDFVPDRFGEPLHTWHKIQKGIEEQLIAGGKIFPDEASGRAAAENDQYFYAESSDPNVSKTLWRRITSGVVSEKIADDPSVELLNTIKSRSKYTINSGNPFPLLTLNS